MTPIHAILVLLIRLWAAGMVVAGLSTVIYYVPWIRFGGAESFDAYSAYGLAQSIIYFLVGIVAWILAVKFAKLSYSTKANSELSVNVDADFLVTIGSFLIGAFYLAEYVPTLIVQSVSVFIEYAQRGPDETTGVGTFAAKHIDVRGFFSALLVVPVAFWMAFKPAQIAHMFSGLRRAGLAKIEKTSPAK